MSACQQCAWELVVSLVASPTSLQTPSVWSPARAARLAAAAAAAAAGVGGICMAPLVLSNFFLLHAHRQRCPGAPSGWAAPTLEMACSMPASLPHRPMPAPERPEMRLGSGTPPPEATVGLMPTKTVP